MALEWHVLGAAFWIGVVGPIAGKFLLAKYVKHYLVWGWICGAVAALGGSLAVVSFLG